MVRLFLLVGTDLLMIIWGSCPWTLPPGRKLSSLHLQGVAFMHPLPTLPILKTTLGLLLNESMRLRKRRQQRLTSRELQSLSPAKVAKTLPHCLEQTPGNPGRSPSFKKP
jgi:Mg2+/citrate symporter